MLMPIHRYIFFFIGIIILFLVTTYIRKGKLSTEFTLLWIITSLFLIFQIVPIDLFGTICRRIHLQPVALVFFIFVLFTVSIIFYYSLLISRLSKSNKESIQKLAILELELKEIKEKSRQ